ncbi:MAG: hypothetical protein H7333_04880 [Bdellovibrionales bacterium]|nr:hypothetical protein [Oligoflexia bacterium]
MRKTGIAILSITFTFIYLLAAKKARADDFNVYQVHRGIDLGESDQQPPKDIFINMGSKNGLKKGVVLDVYRKISSFDDYSQKLIGDHMIPVGRIKVIHADDKSSIARLDKYVSIEQEPAMLPQAIMIGDVVRPVE